MTFGSAIVLTVMLVAQSVTVGRDQARFAADDRVILELVLEQVAQHRSGLRGAKKTASPMIVVNEARPVCREKVYERDPPWPILCTEDPLRVFKHWPAAKSSGQLPSPLSESDRLALVESFHARNTAWQALPAIRSKEVRWISKRAYWDGEVPLGDFVVASLPGYSKADQAVTFVTFSCGSLCGTAWIVMLERDGPAWKVVLFQSLYIS
jgi:hypothetical protein